MTVKKNKKINGRKYKKKNSIVSTLNVVYYNAKFKTQLTIKCQNFKLKFTIGSIRQFTLSHT